VTHTADHPEREPTERNDLPRTQPADSHPEADPPLSTSTTRSGRKSRLATIATALVVFAILFALVWREREALTALDLQHAWPALVIGQVLMFGGLVVAAGIWAAIMRALGSRVPPLRHIHIYATTYLSRHLPGTVWYVLGRGVLYRNEGEPARLVTVASAVELMITVMAGAVTASALLFTVGTRAMQGTIQGALIAVGVAAIVSAGLLHPATLNWATRRLHLDETPRLRLHALATWLGLYTLTWLAGGLILYLNARALLGNTEAALPVGYVLFAWCLVGTLSVFIFFLPSNFGLSEIGLGLLLSAVMPSSVAVVAAILTRLLQIFFAAIACMMIAAASNYILHQSNRRATS